MSRTNNNIEVQGLTKAIKTLGKDMDSTYANFKGLINHKALPNGLLDISNKQEKILDIQHILSSPDFEPFVNELTRYHVVDGTGKPKFDSKGNPIHGKRKLYYAMFPKGSGKFIIQPDGLVFGISIRDNTQRKGFKNGFLILKEYSREHLWDWIFKVKKHCQNWCVYIQSILLWDIKDVDQYGFNIGAPTPDCNQT